MVWLPPSPQGALGPGTSTWRRAQFTIDGPVGTEIQGELPLVIDGADDQLDVNTSIADLFASTYRLRRVVGKIFVSATETLEAQAAGPRVLGVTAAIIVRRTDSQTGQSFAGLTGLGAQFSPSQIINSDDPWVWRRNWVVSDRSAPLGATPIPFPDVGFNNIGLNAGSAVDGPHVDQKTARIVGPEERLFLDMSVTVLATGAQDPQLTTSCDILFDLRVLASLRSSSGNRRNASR